MQYFRYALGNIVMVYPLSVQIGFKFNDQFFFKLFQIVPQSTAERQCAQTFP